MLELFDGNLESTQAVASPAERSTIVIKVVSFASKRQGAHQSIINEVTLHAGCTQGPYTPPVSSATAQVDRTQSSCHSAGEAHALNMKQIFTVRGKRSVHYYLDYSSDWDQGNAAAQNHDRQHLGNSEREPEAADRSYDSQKEAITAKSVVVG